MRASYGPARGVCVDDLHPRSAGGGSRDLRTARCTFYCYAVPFVWIATPGQQGTGASLWISQVTRIPPRSVDPLVKNYHWLDMEVAQLDAYGHGAQLVVLRDDSGAITEGPGSTCSPMWMGGG